MTEGTIEIHGLRCPGGDVTGGEHLVDVWVDADLDRAIASDSLDAAIDIAAIAATIRRALDTGPRRRLDDMAGDAARAILGRFSEVRAVRLRLTAPTAGGVSGGSSELTLAR